MIFFKQKFCLKTTVKIDLRKAKKEIQTYLMKSVLQNALPLRIKQVHFSSNCEPHSEHFKQVVCHCRSGLTQRSHLSKIRAPQPKQRQGLLFSMLKIVIIDLLLI